MRRIFYFFNIAFITLLFFQSCSDPDVSPDMEEQPLLAEVIENKSYGSDSQQVYDIYLPAGRSKSKTKIIILVHGGGWVEGDKADMQPFITLIQQRHPNHAIVNMNYVLATSTIPAFPNQFLDVEKVINNLTAESEALQILPEFGMIGTSAGAHLALQYDYVYDANDKVKFIADIVGPTNFKDPFYQDNPNFQLLLELLVDEAQYPGVSDYTAAVSPALRVSKSSSPTIMFYGNEDPLVPLTNGQTLRDELISSEITNSFNVYEGGHGNDWSEANITDLENKLSNYINTYLAIN